MSDNKKLKKAIRQRMARTGERYTTARRHIEAKLAGHKVDPARLDTDQTAPAKPIFDYISLGPDGQPTGKGVLLEQRLKTRALGCDSCGWFGPEHDKLTAGMPCSSAVCAGTTYVWLHPDRMNPNA